MGFFQRILGSDGATQLAVKSKFGGGAATGVAHVAEYPMDLGSTGGSYSLGVTSGTMAAGLAGAAEIFQFRFVSATKVCVVRSVRFSASVAGTAFAVGAPAFTLTIARAWSAQGGAGTAVTLGTNEGKRRTSLATSDIAAGDIRFSATAALTAGTKVLDSNVTASIVGSTGTATTGQIVPPGTFFWNRDLGNEYPIVLATQEGFAIRATVPATGTWAYAVAVEWAEVASADF